MLIFAVRYANAIKSRPSYIRKRSFKNFVPSDCVTAVQQVSWLDVYLCIDVDLAVRLVSEKNIAILDQMAPMKTVQIRTNYIPWLSQLTKDLMQERDRLQKLAVETKNQDDWRNYKNLRNRINNRLKSEEKDWQRSKIKDCGQDSKKLWKSIKDILNWKSSGSPAQLFHNGQLITSLKKQQISRTNSSWIR